MMSLLTRARRSASGLRLLPTLTRRHLQIGLGLLWLLDAALQFQPYMFSSAFGREMIGGAASGQPVWVAWGMHWAASLVAAQPVLLNAAFATIQLAIAISILWWRSTRFGLAASMAWALGVWYFGEGLGGLASGQASLISGAPGAVALYGLLACLAWPHRAGLRSSGDSQVPVSRFAVAGWVTVWLGGAMLQLLPAQRTSSALASAFGAGVPDGDGWLAGADRAMASAVRDLGQPSVVLLVGVLSAVAVGAAWAGAPRRISAVVGAAIAGAIWLFGEDLGALSSGQSTDPNSGPLLVLLAVAVFGAAGASHGADVFTTSRAGPEGASGPGAGIGSVRRRPAGAPGSIRPRRPGQFLLVAVPAALSGCAALGAPAAGSAAEAMTMASTRSGMAMSTGASRMAGAESMPRTGTPHRSGPSAAARMICGSETGRNVALLLGLSAPPTSSSTWAADRYTCSYAAYGGHLVLFVQQTPNPAAARRYFSALHRSLGSTRVLGGMAGLGLPAYESTKGVVVFLKDSDVLVVDTSGLPSRVGPTGDSPTDVAYSVATDIIACWRGD